MGTAPTRVLYVLKEVGDNVPGGTRGPIAPYQHQLPARLDAFGTFWHDAGAGLGKGAIPMRGDTPRRRIALAAFIGGPALFVAAFFVAAHNYAMAAVLAFVAVIAFAAVRWLAKRRRRLG
jgi:hypothetical protein